MSAFTLKLIACLSMLIDHVGAGICPEVMTLRYVGRLSFPIYAFLLSEGWRHTRSPARYLGRLFLFALLSEVPFDLYFDKTPVSWGHQNVFFTLFLGLLTLEILKNTNSLYMKVLLVTAVCVFAQEIHSDYRYPGILMILSFAYFREFEFPKNLCATGINIRLFPSRVQAAGSFALIPIACYNGKKGPDLKYFFYAFYPGHLFLLYAIREWVLLK